MFHFGQISNLIYDLVSKTTSYNMIQVLKIGPKYPLIGILSNLLSQLALRSSKCKLTDCLFKNYSSGCFAIFLSVCIALPRVHGLHCVFYRASFSVDITGPSLSGMGAQGALEPPEIQGVRKQKRNMQSIIVSPPRIKILTKALRDTSAIGFSREHTVSSQNFRSLLILCYLCR